MLHYLHKRVVVTASLLALTYLLHAQPDRWQQRIKYQIDAQLNDQLHLVNGTENIEYTNNSPDTLHKLMFHLYWNAFQPNSSMDVRSRELGKQSTRNDRKGNPVPDWDDRVRDKISKLSPTEIGYQQVKKVTIDGVAQTLRVYETILEVRLQKPLLPKSKTLLKVDFEAQVPVQIRRAGRNNAEGVAYSMSQWYPKMVEYDYQGWNANPYIAREFYGVWGDYEVKLTLNKRYMVAATGVLQNANTIGYGYETPGTKVVVPTGKNLTWLFKGENIHDFVWAADTAYKHLSKKLPTTTLHVFYKAKDAQADSAWSNVLWAAEKVLPYIEKRFGKYPYPQYSFIQGGDGGMEYAMATLLKGPGLGTVFHEWMHSWYQHILATNESLFGWMDEGFTSYAENEVTDFYNNEWALQSPYINETQKANLLKQIAMDKNDLPAKQADNYAGYFALAKSPFEEPMSTHADHFNTNMGYSLASYSKGATFVGMLGYLVGDAVRDNILLAYYDQWKFKHPNANDFIRVAEKQSGLTLQWFKEYWMNSTKTIDYAVGDINVANDGNLQVTLKRIGKMPMPLDVLITFKDGSKELHYIPLNLLYGEKKAENNLPRTVHTEWNWTHPEYQLVTKRALKDLKSIEIDPSFRMADINRNNNKLVIPE